MRNGVSRFDCRNDAFRFGKILESVYRFVIGHGNIFRTPDIVEVCVFGTDTGIVKSCGNGVNGCDLTVFILAEIGLHPVEEADSAGIDGCRRFKGVNASACRFAANQTNARIFDEMIEAADGVGASAHTGDNGIGQPAFFFEGFAL